MQRAGLCSYGFYWLIPVSPRHLSMDANFTGVVAVVVGSDPYLESEDDVGAYHPMRVLLTLEERLLWIHLW